MHRVITLIATFMNADFVDTYGVLRVWCAIQSILRIIKVEEGAGGVVIVSRTEFTRGISVRWGRLLVLCRGGVSVPNQAHTLILWQGCSELDVLQCFGCSLPTWPSHQVEWTHVSTMHIARSLLIQCRNLSWWSPLQRGWKDYQSGPWIVHRIPRPSQLVASQAVWWHHKSICRYISCKTADRMRFRA